MTDAMGEVSPLQTERLLMREWCRADVEPFVAMNQDPRVMEHFPSVMSREQTLSFIDRIKEHFDDHGFGLWALEPNDGEPVSGFIGFVGLLIPRFEAGFTPCVEVGWRLRADAWGLGYATEAARAAVGYGFETIGLDEIVSFTPVANTRSRAVMKRLGMTHDPADDFDHPSLPPGDRVRRHVLYRIRAETWRRERSPTVGP